MDELQELHVASVLQNVESLFGNTPAKCPGQGDVPIYSCVGPVLIAMSPLRLSAHLGGRLGQRLPRRWRERGQ